MYLVSYHLSKSSLCSPWHLVKVSDRAISELPVLQNVESCGRKISIHKKYKTKWVFLFGMYFITWWNVNIHTHSYVHSYTHLFPCVMVVTSESKFFRLLSFPILDQDSFVALWPTSCMTFNDSLNSLYCLNFNSQNMYRKFVVKIK